MRNHGNREITIKKSDLINKLAANKLKHIKEYGKAVKAYKKEANKQIALLKTKNELGDLDLDLRLIAPINNSDNYDFIIEMFEWEIESTVTLTQDEFRQYVQDENSFTEQALYANSMYLSQ